MPKGAPYEWIRKWADVVPPELHAATEAKLNAVLNFVDYKGERFTFLANAVTALLDSTHSNEYRRRLQRCAMMGKRHDFVDKVAGGRRYKRGIHTPYINHFRGPDPVTVTAAPIAMGQPVPVPSTSTSASSSSGRFVPPKAKDCAPPKPALVPHPGPAPVKPPGQRYGWVHPFTSDAVVQYYVTHREEPISIVINSRHVNWSGESNQIRTVLCMWQVAAALGSPNSAQDLVNEWIINMYRQMRWAGVRLGDAPSKASIHEQANFIGLALDNAVRVFAPLDGMPAITDVVNTEAFYKYNAAASTYNKVLADHTKSKADINDWFDRWYVPPAPLADECVEVAPPKGATWKERDEELRKRAITLSDSEDEAAESETKKIKRAVKVE